jgi:hypothetical protein
MFQEAIVSLIREKCPPGWEVVLFKGHILVHLPKMEGDFLVRYRKVKKEITGWVVTADGMALCFLFFGEMQPRLFQAGRDSFAFVASRF